MSAAAGRCRPAGCCGAAPLRPGAFTPTFAGACADEAAPGSSGTETQGSGFLFLGDEDAEIQCTWIVPPSYDEEAANPPERRIPLSGESP